MDNTQLIHIIQWDTASQQTQAKDILVVAGRLRRPEVVIHVVCVVRALQRTHNTHNVYYNFRSPKATRHYEDIFSLCLLRGGVPLDDVDKLSIVQVLRDLRPRASFV